MRRGKNMKKDVISDSGKRRYARFQEIWRRFRKNRTAVIGLVIITIFILVSIFGELLVPYQMATEQHVMDKLQTPNAEHIFGTDHLGRDLFARVVHGTKYSLMIGVVTTLCTLVISLVLASLAGYFGGAVDNLIMRFMDIMTAIPSLVLAMAIVAALGRSVMNMFIALTISGIPPMVRVIRSSILNVVNQEYIEAARACNTKTSRILIKHVLANAIGPIIVTTTMNVASRIMNAATLSYMGLGFLPPTPEWGAMLSDAKAYMRTIPTLMIFPGICIILTTLSINLVGDGLRDALDPKLKN